MRHPHTVYFTQNDWTIEAGPYIYTPYIIHNCDPAEMDRAYTKCIVPQAPMSSMTYSEYIKQVKCQFCNNRPPDDVITIWTFLNWDKLNKGKT